MLITSTILSSASGFPMTGKEFEMVDSESCANETSRSADLRLCPLPLVYRGCPTLVALYHIANHVCNRPAVYRCNPPSNPRESWTPRLLRCHCQFYIHVHCCATKNSRIFFSRHIKSLPCTSRPCSTSQSDLHSADGRKNT